eukprot:CAMPEP_0205805452 /NCGR_PEP_ID=MMETSP0205-20121125/8682_1 /ASSEMBLY_ACC=CAM_ASM_000278 /TAXON_ID=36767 /ORGANISM="Euplotes focardii, Strain TN1" /LENGTH=245 /DNA_ID=CAMNT_0053076697 /DNA_START=9 /DNA_END=746 /DNA_ORIENTATION=-
MKIILLLAVVLALAFAAPFSATKHDDGIKIDLDINEESPISFAMKGLINPRNEEMNKIQTFLRIAGEYIPILEQLGSADNSLQYRQFWNINFLGINVDVTFYFQLIVGWRVDPGTAATGRFDVVYTPFAFGETSAHVNGTTWPVQGSTELHFQYLHVYAPVALSLYNSGRVCFGADYVVEDAVFRNHIYGSLRECQDEILDDLINGTPIFVWSCNYIAPVNVTLFDVTVYNGVRGDLGTDICIDF